MKVLTDLSIGVIVVEHRDRLTRFGFHSIEQVMQTQGRRIEVIFPNETKNDLVDDAHRGHHQYGEPDLRTPDLAHDVHNNIQQCVEQVMKKEDAEEDERLSGGAGSE